VWHMVHELSVWINGTHPKSPTVGYAVAARH